MWLFLATEVMFFGGLLTAFAVYRSTSPREVALASRHLNVPLGLLEHGRPAGQQPDHGPGRPRRPVACTPPLHLWLGLTMVLGTAFLAIKAVEYTHDYHEKLIPGLNFQVPGEDRAHGRAAEPRPRKMKMFFVLYFFMTGLHAIHLDDRHRAGRRHGVSVVDPLVFRWRRDPDRGDRALLALHRHHLGLSLPLALSHRRPPMNQHIASIRSYIAVFIALLVLLFATVGAAYLPMGPLHFPVAMIIAAAKAVLIVLIFMHALHSHRLTARRLLSLAALAGDHDGLDLERLPFAGMARHPRQVSRLTRAFDRPRWAGRIPKRLRLTGSYPAAQMSLPVGQRWDRSSGLSKHLRSVGQTAGVFTIMNPVLSGLDSRVRDGPLR